MDVILLFVLLSFLEFQYKGEACSTFNVTYGGREYWCSPKYLNFDSAEHECAINGGHLAEIPDEETNVAIHLALEFLRIDPENRWIGVHDRIQEGEFVNMRNKKQKYLQWGNFGPPTGIFKPEADCVSSLLGTWWALNCSNLFQALCSKTLGYTAEFITQPQSTFQTEKLQITRDITLLSSSSRQHISVSQPQTMKTVSPQFTQNYSSSPDSFTTTRIRTTSKSSITTENDLVATSQEIEPNTQDMSKNDNASYLFEFGGCTCACRRDFGTDNQTWVQEMKIARIKTMLLVAKSTLSSRIRQKISADDPRMTSRVMGNVLGGGVLTVIVFLVLSNDILKLYRHITEHECN